MDAGATGPTYVIALGGNAILRSGDEGTIDEQAVHAREALAPVARLAGTGARIVLTHGNGPVVGNILIRNEAAAAMVAPMPLYIADADSEGGIGFLLQYLLYNLLQEAGVGRSVVTIITQVAVDPADPAFDSPSKPVGPHYSADRATELATAQGWTIREMGPGVWRRVVASPRPVRVVELDVIARLAAAGVVVIAAGGGGVPVAEDERGLVLPIDAVIDKDWTSSLLACDMDANALVILMESDALYLGWGTEAASRLESITVSRARELLASGAFAAGSIAPKVAACAHFAEQTGRDAIVCATGALDDALSGTAGTRVVRG